MTKITLADLPKKIQEKIVGKLPSEMEKIQFYPSDLEYALNIGTIVDMHVETLESGIQVLRMDTLKKPAEDQYKTVKVQKKPAAPKPHKQTGRPAREPAPPRRKEFPNLDFDDSAFSRKFENPRF